jgi:hypothetical protein
MSHFNMCIHRTLEMSDRRFEGQRDMFNGDAQLN